MFQSDFELAGKLKNFAPVQIYHRQARPFFQSIHGNEQVDVAALKQKLIKKASVAVKAIVSSYIMRNQTLVPFDEEGFDYVSRPEIVRLIAKEHVERTCNKGGSNSLGRNLSIMVVRCVRDRSVCHLDKALCDMLPPERRSLFESKLQDDEVFNAFSSTISTLSHRYHDLGHDQPEERDKLRSELYSACQPVIKHIVETLLPGPACPEGVTTQGLERLKSSGKKQRDIARNFVKSFPGNHPADYTSALLLMVVNSAKSLSRPGETPATEATLNQVSSGKQTPESRINR